MVYTSQPMRHSFLCASFFIHLSGHPIPITHLLPNLSSIRHIYPAPRPPAIHLRSHPTLLLLPPNRRNLLRLVHARMLSITHLINILFLLSLTALALHLSTLAHLLLCLCLSLLLLMLLRMLLLQIHHRHPINILRSHILLLCLLLLLPSDSVAVLLVVG